MNNMLLISPDLHKIKREMQLLREGYDLTDYRELKYYLRNRFIKHPNVSIELTQPIIIQ